MISGMTSLALSASRLLDKGALRQVIVELGGGFLLVSAIRDGSCLGIVTAAGTDLGQVGYESAMLMTTAPAAWSSWIRATASR
jgi:uncharacterized protein